MRTIHVLAVFVGFCFVALISSSAVADRQTPIAASQVVDNAVVFVYDPGDGNLSVVVEGGPGITTVEVRSAGRSIKAPERDPGLPNRPDWGQGLFDIFTSAKLFKLDPAGFKNVDFGSILPAGWGLSEFQTDILVDGSLVGGGGLNAAPGGGPYVVVVPEPSGVVLLGAGILASLGLARRRM